jgi:hypothetical protein
LALSAQKTTGEIKGEIQDLASASVPKAAVTARDTSTGLSFATTSAADGSYLVGSFVL